MPLRVRLTLIFALVAGVLLVTFGGVLILWQDAQQTRFDEALLDLQSVGWRRVESAELARLRVHAEAVASGGGPLAEVLARDSNDAHPTALQASDGKRLDVFDRRGRILYSTAATLSQDTQMLDFADVRRVLGGETVQGLVPVVGGSFSFVVALPVRIGDEIVGGMALGEPTEPALNEMSQQLGSPVALFNLRGHAVSGNGTQQFTRLAPTMSLRRQGVIDVAHDGRDFLVASIPLRSHDQRLVGGLAALRDVSAHRDHDRLLLVGLAGGAVLFIVLVLAGLFFQLRRALAPLGRAVQVLTALSRGDTSVRLDTERLDESGQIADGIARLRGEMINLEDLRDERQRERRRQERIIRDELRALAGTLDTQGRTQVLVDLEAALSGEQAVGEDGNRLAVLALVLRGLSTRIRSQQERMLQLLADLNEALRTKEAFVILQQELEIARRMQLSILPRVFPARGDVSLASMMLPAQEVGGDFYDYFMLDDRRLGVAIADVSGKGVPAAFFMAISRTLLKATARFIQSPAETLSRVNKLLAAENEELMFVTLFYGVLELDTGRFIYASGGHNPPVLRSADGTVTLLRQPGGMALAVEMEAPFAEDELLLAPDDVLFLYTDGITEAQDPEHRLFGEAALLSTVQDIPDDAPVDAYPARIVAALHDFVREAPQADDITCVTLRFHGPEPRAADG